MKKLKHHTVQKISTGSRKLVQTMALKKKNNVQKVPNDLSLDQKPSVGRGKCKHPDIRKRYWNDKTIYIPSMQLCLYSSFQ